MELKLQSEELYRAVEEARSTADQYIELYDRAPVGYCTIDDNGIIQKCNLRLATMLGVDRILLTQGLQQLSRFVLSSDEGTYYLFLQSLKSSVGSKSCELRLENTHKLVLYVEILADSIVDNMTSHDDRERFDLVIIDITDKFEFKSRAENLLKRFNSMFDGASEGIMIIDAEGKLIDANRAFAEMHGYSPEEIRGLSLSQLDVPETARLSKERIRRIMAGECVKFEVEHYHKEGSIFPLEVTASLVKVSGESYIQSFHRDISERNRMLKALQEYQCQLESRISERTELLQQEIIERTGIEASLNEAVEAADAANGAKSIFMAHMSHEIRTPLSGLLGMTGLLLEESLTDRQRNYAEKIKKSGAMLLDVVNDILDYSKINAGKTEIERIVFSLDELIPKLVEVFSFQAAEKGLKLQAVIPDIPPLLLGDPLRLSQVLNNLLNNAIKFTAAGEIRLTVNVLKSTASFVHLEISIADTGIGMSKAEMSSLFIPFNQADSSTTRRYGGSGLGLTISRQLIELMGGTIRVESSPGQGSVFTFLLCLPVAQPVRQVNMQTLPRGDRRQYRDVRALVAEDVEINREIIVAMLESSGIEVDVAINGREAVEMAAVQNYDIVFMDIQMPELDGLDAAREIRGLPHEKLLSLPIIALTAHALPGDREKSLVAGMNDHLDKPIEREVLEDVLQRWLPVENMIILPGPPDVMATNDVNLIHGEPGLDVPAALQRLDGNGGLYLKLLRDFVAGYGDAAAQVREGLRADLRDEAIHLIHSMKGVAGNIGGKELAAAAAELERACRTSGVGVPLSLGVPLRRFTACHEALIAAIGLVLAKHPAALQINQEGLAGNPTEMMVQLLKLKKVLETGEPKPCIEIITSLMAMQWPESIVTFLNELDKLIWRFRFGDALAILNEQVMEIGITGAEMADEQ